MIEPVVSVARAVRADYGPLEPGPAPELRRRPASVAARAVRDVLRQWGLDSARVNTAAWNPLGALIPPGSRVVIKPNWVLHENLSGHGLDCLVTNSTLIEAVIRYVALTSPRSVIVGDAPLQGCDFERLLRSADVYGMQERLARDGIDVSLEDFRRTLLPEARLGGARVEGRRPQHDYVLFDLGTESLLEPLAGDASRFRVTMYNPDLLQRTHAPGRHQYLIARPVVDADVVINLPKLKCHKKAGLTGALKNLVGINGNKEFLPHHRKGSHARGGDCYERSSWLKSRAEDLLDAANRGQPGRRQQLLGRSAQVLARGAALAGHDSDLEGSWYGNDTVWRMCLDLQRILRYGAADGRLHREPRRVVITITDAIVGGDGEGPLAPSPVDAALVIGGTNPAAVDWVNAVLMGFDPVKIPIVQRAFDPFSWPLANFAPEAIQVHAPHGPCRAADLRALNTTPFRPPAGWRGHCEWTATPREVTA